MTYSTCIDRITALLHKVTFNSFELGGALHEVCHDATEFATLPSSICISLDILFIFDLTKHNESLRVTIHIKIVEFNVGSLTSTSIHLNFSNRQWSS